MNSDTTIDLFPKKMWAENARTDGIRENLNHFCFGLPVETWEELLNRLQANPEPRFTFGIPKGIKSRRGSTMILILDVFIFSLTP
jgi:hypothetical protein